jgi:hypothetical protein
MREECRALHSGLTTSQAIEAGGEIGLTHNSHNGGMVFRFELAVYTSP